MNNQAEVVLDVDGVLADFEGYFCRVFGDKNRHLVGLEKRYPEKKDKIAKFVRDPMTYRYLDILPLGFQIAQWLDNNDVIVHIVSSRPIGTYDITKDWLNAYHIPYTSLTVKTDKISTIKSLQPHLIVDDIIGVAEECYRSKSIPGVLVAQPWNESIFFPRVDTIQDFIYSYKRLVDVRLVQ